MVRINHSGRIIQVVRQYYIFIQILPIEELLHGAEVKMPPQFCTFKQAQKVGEQAELDFG